MNIFDTLKTYTLLGHFFKSCFLCPFATPEEDCSFDLIPSYVPRHKFRLYSLNYSLDNIYNFTIKRNMKPYHNKDK